MAKRGKRKSSLPKVTKTPAVKKAPANHGPKRRKNSKEKIQIVAIAITIVALLIAAKYMMKQSQIQKEAQEIENARGDVIGKTAEQANLDVYGKEVEKTVKYRVISVYSGDGMATLIDCGTNEILIDCGAEDTSEQVSPYVEGKLEYFISTCAHDDCIKGYQGVYEDFEVERTLYAGREKTELYEAFLETAKNPKQVDMQNINIDNKLTLSIYNDDKTAMCVLCPNSAYSYEGRIAIIGKAKETLLENNLGTLTDSKFMIINDSTLKTAGMKKVFSKMNNCTVILSGDEASPESLSNCSEASARLYILKDIGTTCFDFENGNLKSEPDGAPAVEYKDKTDIEKEAREVEGSAEYDEANNY